MVDSELLNPVVALRDAFEGLPDFVRLPIEMVVFGGMLPNTDISQMRWMAEELRTDAAALGQHADAVKNVLAQEHSIGRFGDGFRDALEQQQDGAGMLREQAAALADQADAAANEAEKHLCVMFVFAIDLAVRLVGMLMAASASGPAGVAAAAPAAQAGLLAGRARVTAMRAAWKQAYERIAANTAARMPKVGPGRFAVVGAVQAAGLTAGVDAGVQGFQVAAGHRDPLLMGADGTNPTGIDLRSIGLAGFAGVAGAAGGMLAARYAPTIFPAVGSSPMLAGLVHGTAGAVSGLGATALVAGWPEHYTELLGALVNGGFSGAVFARAGMPRPGVVPQTVDGSGGFVHPDGGAAGNAGPSVARGISPEARAEWARAEAAWSSGDRTGATVPDRAVSADGTSGAPTASSAAVTTPAAADSVPGGEPGHAERTESAGRSDPSAVDRPESATAAAQPAESVPGVVERAEPVSVVGRAEPVAAPGPSGHEAVADPMWASPDVRGTEPGAVAAHPDPAAVAAGPESVAGRVETSGAAAGADAARAGGRPETTGAPGRPETVMPAGRGDTPAPDGAQRNPAGGRMPGEALRTVSAAGETAPAPKVMDTAANRPHASTAAALTGAASDRPVPRGAASGAEAGRNGMGTEAGRVRSSDDGHTTSAQAGTDGAGSEPATAGGENTSGERVDPAADSGETTGEPGISGDRAVPGESDTSGDRALARDTESAGASGDRVPDGPTSRERAEEILADFHARSAEHLPANLRLSNLSDEAVAAGLFHGSERDSLSAGMEIIRRQTVSEQIPGGMVLRPTQLEGVLELAAGRPVEMLPGQGKTLMFMLHSMRQAVSEGSVLLVTTADGLAHREFTEYRRVLEPFGIDVLRADQESGFGHKPGRPAIVVATGETVGHLCNSGQEAPPRSVVIDEMDAVVDRGEKTFIRSESQSEAAAQPTAQEVFDAHDFLAGALAKGQLSHEDFGLKRLVEEVDIELPDGTFEIGADYWYDGQASLTSGGVEKVQALPGGQRWLQDMGRSRLEMAAAAEFTTRNKTHYVMDQGKIVIIDQGEHGLQRNPKTSSETRWSAEEGKAGLAQAVEAKEIRAAEAIGMSAEQHGIVLRADTDSATSITAAEIYGTDRFFDHVTGASGTLADLGGVLKTVYNLDTPHRVDPYNPVRLVEGAPEVHENTRAKLHALAESAHVMWDGGHGRFQEILCHRNDLVEKQVNALVRAGVPREAIEAVDATRIAKWGADWETRLQNVFDAAGAQGKILVINRQGQRGVDISPSDEVLAQGGMHVWMTEVPEQSYIYEQGKNRTARNGAPGSAQAFMSPQDGIIRNAVHLSGVHETVVSYEQAVGAHRADPTPETHHAVVESADALASLVPGLQDRAHHQQTAQFLLRYAPISEPEALLAAVTPWHPDNAGLAGSDTPADRVRRLAGLLGVPPPALTAGATDETTRIAETRTAEAADPLRELLRRAAVPPAAVEALHQSIDATAPGRAVRYALLTDEQALDHLISRRAPLAAALGWDAAEVEGAEGLRQVGDAATAAQRELARALTAAADPGPASERGPGPSSDVSPALAEVSTTMARDILGEALIGEVSGGAANRQYGSETEAATARADRTAPHADVVEAAAHYLATTALLDLVTEIHRRSPNNCVDNGVTGMRVLFPDKADHFTMPPGGLALRGRNWATTRQSFRNGAPQESRSLDDAVASLKQRPGGAQVLVYRWKNSEGRSTDADNHLVVLVNDSTDPARPKLKVVDFAASPDGDYTSDYGPEHLADRRALLNRAVPLATWQREQERYLGRLSAADRRFWTIDFDAAGELAGDPGTAAMTERPEVRPEQERAVEEAPAPVPEAGPPRQPGPRIDALNSRRGAEPVGVGARPSEDAVVAPAEPAATARQPQPAAEIEAGQPNWRVRRLRDELELARYLYHKEETKHAARAMIVRMREVLTALHPDATADQIESAFLAPERVLDGMVPRSVSLDELLAGGNLRELMQALYNPIVRRGDLMPGFETTGYAAPMLYAGLARLMNERGEQQSWEERARELGLDVIALREVRDRITGGDPQRDVGEGDLMDIVNQAHDAPDLDDIVAERTWSSAEERAFGLRQQVRLGITVQDWALLGMPLSRWEIHAIPGELVALRKSRLDPRRELRRDEHGLVREDILEDRLRFEDQLRSGSGITDTVGPVRFVIPAYAYDDNGRRMRDESGDAVVTDVFVYRDAGVVDAETALALDPGEFAVPLPWGTGSSTVTFDKEGRLFRELAVEQGIPLLAGISGSAARLASAFRWLRPEGVGPVDFAGAILAKLSPSHHSMYEQLRGMQLTGLRLPLVDEAVSRARYGAVNEMFAGLSEQFDRPPLHHTPEIVPFTLPDDGDTPRATTERDETGSTGAVGSTLPEPGGRDAGSPGWIGSRPADSGARPEESSSSEARRSGVTAENFPLPGRLDQKTRPHTAEAAADLDRLAEFAQDQADWANTVVADLRGLDRPPGPADWEQEFWKITDQRTTTTASEAGPGALSEAIDRPRRTRLGDIPRYGEGPIWIPGRQTPVGLPTWARETFAAAGARARRRFTAEGVTGDILETRIRLTDGTTALGRRLIRGETAENLAQEIRQRRAERTGKLPFPGPALAPGQVFSETSSQEERTRILDDAFAQLAAPGEFTTATWAEIAYKLFHAPQRKSGSDAVIRSFMAAVGVHHLGRVPEFPHDIDLLAMVTSQDEFIALILEHGNITGEIGSPSTGPVGDAVAPGGTIGRRPGDDAAGGADAGPGWVAVESLRRDVFAGHTTIADIGVALQAELRALPGGADYSVRGFDLADADVDIGELRVYAQAVLDICTVFPGHTKRSIVLGRHDFPRHIRTYDSSYPAERQRQIVLDLRTGRSRGQPEPFPMEISPVGERRGDSAERARYRWAVRDLVPHLGIPGWEYAGQLVLPTLMESFEQDFAATARPVERQRGPHWDAFDDWQVLQGLGRGDLMHALGREYTVAVGVAAAFAEGRAMAYSPAGRLYELLAAQDGIEKRPITGDAPIGELREATNAEMLGVPPDLVDEFSVIGADAHLGDPDTVARVNQAVGDTLQRLLRGFPGHENIKVSGFDSPHLDTDVVKEVARGMVWLMRTYPNTDIREVGFGDLSYEDAKAGTLPRYGAVRCYTESIVFDTTWAASAGEVRKEARRTVATGLHPESFLLRPVLAYTAHEYMHALGVAGSNDGEVAALEALADLYLAEELGEPTPAGWLAWLRTTIPAYGFDAAGRFIAEESVANGGADVAVRRYVLGPHAEVRASSLVQHDLLVEAAARNAQHGRWESMLDAHRFRRNESLLQRYRQAGTMLDVAGQVFDAARTRVLGAMDTSGGYAYSDRPERSHPSDAGNEDGARSEESRGNMGDGLIGRRPSVVPPAQRYGPGISDEWSELIDAGTSRLGRNRAIGARLQSVLRALPGHGDVVVKFDDARLTPEVLAEFARAWVTLFSRYPDVDVPVIEPSILWEGEAVSAFASDDRRRTRVAGSSAEQEPPQVLALYVNRRFFLKPDVFRSESARAGTPDDPYDDYFLEHVHRAVAAGELPAMVPDRPAYAVAVLAFAAALDISRGRADHPAVDELLREAFAGTGRPQHGPEFRRWQLEMLPDAVEWSTGVLEKSKALALGLLSTELPGQEEELLTGLAGLLDAHDGSAPRSVAATDTRSVPLPEPGNAALMPTTVIDDEWAALSTGHDIATHLRNVLYAETGRHFEVTGFDSEMDLDVLREYARTAFEFRDDLAAYNVPEIAIIDTEKANGTRSLGYAELAYDEDATPRRYEYERPSERAVRLVRARRLVLDRNYAMNAENFWRAKTIVADNGYHPDSGRHRPVRAVVLYELGHAADYAGHGVARTLIANALLGHYIAKRLGPSTVAGYEKWLKSRLCGYSFHADGRLNTGEAIASAFSDVRSQGYDNVGDAVRIIYDLTVKAADNSPAGRARRSLDRRRFGAARYHRRADGTITRRTSRSSIPLVDGTDPHGQGDTIQTSGTRGDGSTGLIGNRTFEPDTHSAGSAPGDGPRPTPWTLRRPGSSDSPRGNDTTTPGRRR
ncbi:hypothetical protein [Nocardia fusca]|uniref:SecA family profile domain-containing protein n=1 Tax=Nocardia fusca TaxID=941183 RepID=A0ABV3FF38_9NOCA